MNIDLALLTEELKRDEGYSGTVYTCSAGKLTVGYGHNLEAKPIPQSIAEKLLECDIGDCMAQCELWPWFFSLNDTRKRVIVNMVFNIGFNGVSNFKKMISALENKDYVLAAAEMTNSKWYAQVGDRATRLVTMMVVG